MLAKIVNVILLLHTISAIVPESIERDPLHPNNDKLLKISMNQNGYLQFFAYKVDVPQITKYTFCIWLKSYNLTRAHPILSTSQNGEDQNIFVYVSPYGRYLVTRILNQELLKVSLQIQENKWSNICQSWDSRTGWWQVYFDGKLIEQGINEVLRHVQVPRSKDLIIGQEFANLDVGLPGGIHGEVFGFNMVLAAATEAPNTYDYQLYKTNKRQSASLYDDKDKDDRNLIDYINDLMQQQQELNKKKRYSFKRNFKNVEEDIAASHELNNDENEDDYSDNIIEDSYDQPYSHLSQDDDSRLTNTEQLAYEVSIANPESKPELPRYQTPPPLPKYLKKNTKVSYESKYASENYHRKPDNDKYAIRVLNHLKNDRHRKNRNKNRRRKPNYKLLRNKNTKKAYVIKPKASRRNAVVVDPLAVEVEVESMGESGRHHALSKLEANKKSINLEIVNPETIINHFKQKKRVKHENRDTAFLVNRGFDDYDDDVEDDEDESPETERVDSIPRRKETARRAPKYSKAAKHDFSSGRGFSVAKPSAEELNRNFGDKTREETFESLYSRLHYTGPRYKSKERKVKKTRDDLNRYYPKTSVTHDDLKPLRHYPMPKAFSTFQESQNRDYIVYEDSLEDEEPFDYNNGTLSHNNRSNKRNKHIPELYEDEEERYYQVQTDSDNIYRIKNSLKDRRRKKHNTDEDIEESNNEYTPNPPTRNVQVKSKYPKAISSGKKLIELSYRKCLVAQGSPMAFDQTSFISWNFTPVTLYGGASVQVADPECGNF